MESKIKSVGIESENKVQPKSCFKVLNFNEILNGVRNTYYKNTKANIFL